MRSATAPSIGAEQGLHVETRTTTYCYESTRPDRLAHVVEDGSCTTPADSPGATFTYAGVLPDLTEERVANDADDLLVAAWDRDFDAMLRPVAVNLTLELGEDVAELPLELDYASSGALEQVGPVALAWRAPTSAAADASALASTTVGTVTTEVVERDTLGRVTVVETRTPTEWFPPR